MCTSNVVVGHWQWALNFPDHPCPLSLTILGNWLHSLSYNLKLLPLVPQSLSQGWSWPEFTSARSLQWKHRPRDSIQLHQPGPAQIPQWFLQWRLLCPQFSWSVYFCFSGQDIESQESSSPCPHTWACWVVPHGCQSVLETFGGRQSASVVSSFHQVMLVATWGSFIPI